MKKVNENIVNVINLIQLNFPEVFPSKPLPKKALKIGIREDLFVWAEYNNISRRSIRLALKAWCFGWRYDVALKPGLPRYNLENEVTGCVSPRIEQGYGNKTA